MKTAREFEMPEDPEDAGLALDALIVVGAIGSKAVLRDKRPAALKRALGLLDTARAIAAASPEELEVIERLARRVRGRSTAMH